MEPGSGIIQRLQLPIKSIFKNQRFALLASISIGLAIVGLLSKYLKRTKSNNSLSKALAAAEGFKDTVPHSNRKKQPFLRHGRRPSDVSRSTISESTIVDSPRHSHAGYLYRIDSTTSPEAKNSTMVAYSIPSLEQSQLSCTQLGLLGAESMDKAIRCWEESLLMLKSEDALPEDEQSERTVKNIEKILESAYSLQMLTEELFLHDNSVLYDDEGREGSLRLRSLSSASVESYASAEDWLSDDDEIRQSLENIYFQDSEGNLETFPLYDTALKLVDIGTVPYRTLKTEMVGVSDDREYLAKLHCLRGAFSRIMNDQAKRDWITINGRQVLSDILVRADRDPRDFQLSFDTFVNWSQEGGSWALIEAELKDRGLRALTFYDIVIDFIFLDAFEDLEAPPASVLAVTRNRWLTNNFKETALGTAVWSVLKTKRRWLKYPDGFMSHFYDLSEHIMPSLAWGFLGPPTELQDLCTFFKEKFLEFLQLIFSFDKVRYTSLDDLVVDIIGRMEEMYSLVSEKLNATANGIENGLEDEAEDF